MKKIGIKIPRIRHRILDYISQLIYLFPASRIKNTVAAANCYVRAMLNDSTTVETAQSAGREERLSCSELPMENLVTLLLPSMNNIKDVLFASKSSTIHCHQSCNIIFLLHDSFNLSRRTSLVYPR